MCDRRQRVVTFRAQAAGDFDSDDDDNGEDDRPSHPPTRRGSFARPAPYVHPLDEPPVQLGRSQIDVLMAEVQRLRDENARLRDLGQRMAVTISTQQAALQAARQPPPPALYSEVAQHLNWDRPEHLLTESDNDDVVVVGAEPNEDDEAMARVLERMRIVPEQLTPGQNRLAQLRRELANAAMENLQEYLAYLHERGSLPTARMEQLERLIPEGMVYWADHGRIAVDAMNAIGDDIHEVALQYDVNAPTLGSWLNRAYEPPPLAVVHPNQQRRARDADDVGPVAPTAAQLDAGRMHPQLEADMGQWNTSVTNLNDYTSYLIDNGFMDRTYGYRTINEMPSALNAASEGTGGDDALAARVVGAEIYRRAAMGGGNPLSFPGWIAQQRRIRLGEPIPPPLR
jgi:hypothetical protein